MSGYTQGIWDFLKGEISFPLYANSFVRLHFSPSSNLVQLSIIKLVKTDSK